MKRGLKEFFRRLLFTDDCVATYAPMKRGLKVARLEITHSDQVVATYAPMKRGLKVVQRPGNGQGARRVATYAPMKRGLKGGSGLYGEPSPLK